MLRSQSRSFADTDEGLVVMWLPAWLPTFCIGTRAIRLIMSSKLKIAMWIGEGIDAFSAAGGFLVVGG